MKLGGGNPLTTILGLLGSNRATFALAHRTVYKRLHPTSPAGLPAVGTAARGG